MKRVEARLDRIEGQLAELLLLLRGKKSKSDYHARYYEKRKAGREKAQAKAASARLLNPDRNMLTYKDRRLSSMFEPWAEVGFRFGTAAPPQPFKFLCWLVYTWQNLYQARPITRSGGYNQVFIGWSGDRPLRHRYTDNDVFGNCKRTKFDETQALGFAKSPWWNWTYGVLYQVLYTMQEHEDRWAKLSPTFTKPLLLMSGGYGEVEVRHGIKFDPNLKHDQLQTVYKFVKPDLDRGWAACIKGLCSKDAPAVPCERSTEQRHKQN
jgi:hypothetical protein